MAKYLVQASYTADGLKGLQKEGASGRVQALRKASRRSAANARHMIGHSASRM